MRILLLSPCPERLMPALSTGNDDILVHNEKISADFVRDKGVDVGISYNYRHILKKDVLDICPFINLHISYLPWNRGADPNLWSWIEDTPKGVTIHYIDEGIDTGDIISREKVEMGENETLKTSYDRLHEAMEDLFFRTWPSIRNSTAPRQKQDVNEGSFHLAADKAVAEIYLKMGYDTPASDLLNCLRRDMRRERT